MLEFSEMMIKGRKMCVEKESALDVVALSREEGGGLIRLTQVSKARTPESTPNTTQRHFSSLDVHHMHKQASNALLLISPHWKSLQCRWI